ncbi:MAG: hypothetical protein ACLFN5_05030 [bacterium]
MNWFKTAAIGFSSALIVYILARLAIFTSILPLDKLPAEIILEDFGLNYPLLAEICVFVAGIVGALLLAWIFENNTTVGKGIIFGGLIWIMTMLIGSPLAGWGLFALTGDHGFLLAAYILVAHLIYGGLTGWLIEKLIYFESGVADEIKCHAQQEG